MKLMFLTHKTTLSAFFFWCILILAATVRLYKIDQYMTFLGDEGRDVLVVKRMIVDHTFTLLGPITSVGSIYMGPVYYYFMIPFLWLWRFDPVGPAVMVALFSLLTIIVLYKTGKEFFHPAVGLVSAYLYALSPLPVLYGRSSWNPNIVPFFSLLIIYCLLHVVVRRDNRWLVPLGFSLGILIQLHYVTFLFFGVIPAVLFIRKFQIPFRYLLFAFLAFLLAYSPFLLFEARHQFVNAHSLWRFILQQNRETQAGGASFFQTVSDVTVRIFWRLVVVKNAEITKAYLLIVASGIAYILRRMRQTNDHERFHALSILCFWFGVGILSYGLYRGVIYDYYFGSLFPAPFLFTGILVWFLFTKSRIGAFLSTCFVLFLTVVYIQHSPVRIEPNNLLGNTRDISRFVFEKTHGEAYNFALIAGKNSDHAYRYFLELWGNPPVAIENPDIDPSRTTVTARLFVVCEEKICQPLGNPLWEIAGFGRAEIVSEWTVRTARVFELMPLSAIEKDTHL